MVFWTVFPRVEGVSETLSTYEVGVRSEYTLSISSD